MRILVAAAFLSASVGAAAVTPPPIDGPAAACLRPEPDRVRAHEFGVTLNIANECPAPLRVRIFSARGVREVLIRSTHRERSRRGGFACQYPHREPQGCDRIEAFLAPFAREDLLQAFGIADDRAGFLALIGPLEPSLKATAAAYLDAANRPPQAPAPPPHATEQGPSPGVSETRPERFVPEKPAVPIEWVCTVPLGPGACIGRNGDRYEGGIRNGLPDGFGVQSGQRGLVSPRDTSYRYEGRWRQGRKHGQGRLQMSNAAHPELNREWSGEWRDDEAIAR